MKPETEKNKETRESIGKDIAAHADKVVADVFLNLTRHRSDRDVFADLLIRPSAIESICQGMDGFTVLNGNRYYSVRETPEEIIKMLKGE